MGKPEICRPEIWKKIVAKTVIASQRVARKRARWQAPRSNPSGNAKKEWIASSLTLLAMTAIPEPSARQHRAGSPTISGCRASETAGEARITSACTPKIAVARYRQASAPYNPPTMAPSAEPNGRAP
jgi:hypothetical protein